jgi:hypothetical protein
MARIGKVLLCGLGGAALWDAWLRVVWNFDSELMAALAFVPFLAAQAVLLHSVNKGRSAIWNLVSCAIAVGLAIPGGVALVAREMLFRWEDWKSYVLPTAWYMKWYFGSFLVVPPLFAQALRHVRSNNRWGVGLYRAGKTPMTAPCAHRPGRGE